MIGSTSTRDIVADALEGEREAKRAVRCAVDGVARPDELLRSLQDVLEADQIIVAGTPRLRAWARAVQKALEASA